MNHLSAGWFSDSANLLRHGSAAVSPSLPYRGEVGRKALHLLALAIPLGMWTLGRPRALLFLVPVAGLAVSADVARAYSVPVNRWIRFLFGRLMRPEELPRAGTGVRLNGATCVLVGATLMAALFPMRLAAPVLAMTMLADAAAALVGRRLGRHPWGSLSATVEGSAAFVGTGLALMAAVPGPSLGPAAAGVLGGAVVEALPLPFNDNIRVPVAAGLAVAGAEAILLDQPFPLVLGA